MNKVILSLSILLVCSGINFAHPPLALADPVKTPRSSLSHAIVYTRVSRTTGTHTVHFKDQSMTLTHADLWDVLPDTAKMMGNFSAPGQLVYRATNGAEKVIYDCVTTALPCVPLDPSVSLDGKKIAFSVYSAESFAQVKVNGYRLPNTLIPQKGESRIYVYDLETEETIAWPHSNGVYDMSPVWLPQAKMLFSSNRNAYSRPWLTKGPKVSKPWPRLYIAAQDGANPTEVSPHEMGGASHPYLYSDGRVRYSSQWQSHNLASWRTNSAMQGTATLDNLWALMSVDQAIGDHTAVLGGHRYKYQMPDGKGRLFKALHFIGERANGDICVTNYYRSNNLGLGGIVCFAPEEIGIEGPAPNFLPSNLYSVTGWSDAGDGAGKRIDGAYPGKVGYPEGDSDNQLILSYGAGFCSQNPSSITKNPAWVDSQPAKTRKVGCDVGLYKTTQIPSLHPSDLQLIVDKPEWHEFGARAVKSRRIAEAGLRKTRSGNCEIVNTDASVTDAYNYNKYKFNSNFFAAANNGTEIQGLPHSDMKAVRFYEVIPNPYPGSKKDIAHNSFGNLVKVLGDAPLLADGSFRVELPCDVPFVMAGVDKAGLVIKRDQLPQSLRPGEERVCRGCHLHGEKGRPYSKSMAATATAVKLTHSRPVLTYENDIAPIVAARCANCHSFNYEDLVWDYLQESVPAHKRLQVTKSTKPKKRYGLQRPYTSKYVNSLFARESLLYWKAANKRMDGRNDATYPDDIDFGEDHPTETTKAELKILGQWLDSGAQEAKKQ